MIVSYDFPLFILTSAIARMGAPTVEMILLLEGDDDAHDHLLQRLWAQKVGVELGVAQLMKQIFIIT